MKRDAWNRQHADEPAEVARVGDWIQTFTGQKFYIFDPRPDDIRINDIAHALANTCRFTGHCPEFYSVAQHSVYVSWHCDKADALWGLLHDAAEAYIADVSRPLKQSFRQAGFTAYDAAEDRVMEAVCHAFGLPLEQPASVKKADELLLATEGRDFFKASENGWRHQPANGYPVLDERLHPWNPVFARRMFHQRFDELRKEAKEVCA